MDHDPTAAVLAEEIRAERAAGLAKSWRNVTTLLHQFRLPKMTPEVCAEVVRRLATAGVTIVPGPEEWERQSKVRLLLPSDDPGAPQNLTQLVTATRWVPGQQPVAIPLAEAASGPGFVWVDVDPSAETAAVLTLLLPLFPELCDEAIQDLVQVDDLPSAGAFGVVRKVSTVAVRADEAEGTHAPERESKAGQLIFQTIELLVGESWLITCWHEPRGTRTEVPAVDMDAEKRLVVDGVIECWLRQDHSSVGALGLLLFRELARSYSTARRTLYSWLEQWELDFHSSQVPIEQDTLRDLRVLVSEFQRRLNALNESRVAVAEHSWFPNTSSSELDSQLDAIVDRSIEGLVSLSGMLRSAVDLLTTAGIREHLRLAEVAARKSDKLQDQVGLVASVLLVPTFIAGLFGANTEVPGQGHWSGFVGMLALMVVGSAGTYGLFRRAKARRDEDL